MVPNGPGSPADARDGGSISTAHLALAATLQDEALNWGTWYELNPGMSKAEVTRRVVAKTGSAPTLTIYRNNTYFSIESIYRYKGATVEEGFTFYKRTSLLKTIRVSIKPAIACEALIASLSRRYDAPEVHI